MSVDRDTSHGRVVFETKAIAILFYISTNTCYQQIQIVFGNTDHDSNRF